DLGPDKDIYVAAMGFADSSGALWLTRLNRHQNRLDLLLADPQTGASRVIMTDSDSAWVDANQPRWIDGGKQFLFMSERDGYDQVYLFDRSGSLVRRVTPGGWDVQDVYGVDEKNRVLYFSGASAGPLERQLMRVGLDGKGLKSLSTEPGTHSAAFAPTFTLYVDTYSRAGGPPVQTLRRTGGRGAKFMKVTYLHLGRYEAADQIAAARWFSGQPYVSPDRIGIWGWSYGGYMTSLSMFRGAGVFRAALAVAPVTDWRFYDTI